jgi:hypothetical protein
MVYKNFLSQQIFGFKGVKEIDGKILLQVRFFSNSVIWIAVY